MLCAQRQMCESFIAAKAAEGWVALPDRYDDYGQSSWRERSHPRPLHGQTQGTGNGEWGRESLDSLFWWGMTISEARLYDFRQVTPHPNAAYYSIFRVRQTVENKTTDVGRHFYAELSEEKIFLLFSINR